MVHLVTTQHPFVLKGCCLILRVGVFPCMKHKSFRMTHTVHSYVVRTPDTFCQVTFDKTRQMIRVGLPIHSYENASFGRCVTVLVVELIVL